MIQVEKKHCKAISISTSLTPTIASYSPFHFISLFRFISFQHTHLYIYLYISTSTFIYPPLLPLTPSFPLKLRHTLANSMRLSRLPLQTMLLVGERILLLENRRDEG